mgnify:CR=1 FL=1
MKHIIVLFIVCTLFPLTMQAQMETVMDMHHDDDTLDVKYTKKMLQGKLWVLEIQEGVEGVAYGCIEFKDYSMHQTYIVEDTKYEFPCVFRIPSRWISMIKENVLIRRENIYKLNILMLIVTEQGILGFIHFG